MHEVDIKAEEITRIDKSDMLGTAYTFPTQVERALRDTKVPEIPFRGKFNKVLLTGLGGSAIGADYLAHWGLTEGKLPLIVNRDYSVPAWVDDQTLVVAISFSGGTEETLAAFADARKRGAKIVAVSTGGKMKDFAAKVGAPFIQVEGGIQPRAALGRMLVADALALDASGALATRAELERSVALLKKMQGDLDPKGPANRNEAKQLALNLKGSIPVVYGSEFMAPVARRFANQLNENSKVLAFWGVMPEMNHNELVGWSGEGDLKRYTAIFLRHESEHPAVAARFGHTAGLIREWGGKVIEIKARGATIAERQLSTTYVTDLATCYLAVLRGQDPTPVQPISGLKSSLEPLGVVRQAESKL